MHSLDRKTLGETAGTIVSDEMNLEAARNELMRQSFGRKEMAAGAASGEKDRCHCGKRSPFGSDLPARAPRKAL